MEVLERLLYAGITLAIVGATLKWRSTALLVAGAILIVAAITAAWNRMENEE
jgi:hypothetical protein